MQNTISNIIHEIQDNDEIFYAVTDYAMDKAAEIDFDELIGVEKDSFLVGKFLSELNNGGFDQYFVNTGGEYAARTVDFLDSIGEKNFSNLLDEAVRIYKAVIADDQKTEEFEELDNRYYYMTSDEYQALYDCFADYLRDNMEELSVKQLEGAGLEDKYF